MTSHDLQNMLVSDVLARNPAAVRVFIERRMGCVGCTFAPFETVGEVARTYGVEARELANELASYLVRLNPDTTFRRHRPRTSEEWSHDNH